MKSLVVDLDRCNGCFCCQIACKDEHCGNDWSPIAVSQPQTGQFWCRVDQRERGRVPVVRVAYKPVFCGQCDDCPLLDLAPDAVYRRADGIIIIDPMRAKGRRELLDACPLGMVYWNERLGVPQKCTGCAHLIDGGWKEPRCVDACATGALQIVDSERLDDAASTDEKLTGMGSHVAYLNAPKRWIAGTVVDRSKNEVVIGASIRIVDSSGNDVARVETDEFGDFKFDAADEQLYSVFVLVDGGEPIELSADCRDKDVVFEDIFVDKA